MLKHTKSSQLFLQSLSELKEMAKNTPKDESGVAKVDFRPKEVDLKPYIEQSINSNQEYVQFDNLLSHTIKYLTAQGSSGKNCVQMTIENRSLIVDVSSDQLSIVEDFRATQEYVSPQTAVETSV